MSIPSKKEKKEVILMIKDLTKWDPFRDILSVKEGFDRLMEDYFGRFPEKVGEEAWYPIADIKETSDEIIVSAEIPGMKKSDIKLTLSDNQLTIQGEKKMEKEEKNETYYRIERAYGKFKRVIPLPIEVEEAKVSATYKDGVLHIKLPKSEKSKKKKIDIEVE